jgi:hypothetical protein
LYFAEEIVPLLQNKIKEITFIHDLIAGPLIYAILNYGNGQGIQSYCISRKPQHFHNNDTSSPLVLNSFEHTGNVKQKLPCINIHFLTIGATSHDDKDPLNLKIIII